MTRVWRAVGRGIAMLLLAVLALQIYFGARVASLAWWDPQSTSFQRSEAWRLVNSPVVWRQQRVGLGAISVHLQRAVVAAEDSGFADHYGVDWTSLEQAWQKNQRNKAVETTPGAAAPYPVSGRKPLPPRSPKLVGGSTITQQLAKNLFFGPERSLLRKSQELVVTGMLELMLPKRRILEIYLNEVEWGQGIFGAEAASLRYFGVHAAQLQPAQAARLAVMLPAPKRFEARPDSPYLMSRSAIVQSRMAAVNLP